MPKLVAPTNRAKELRPVRPNAGIAAAYRKAIDAEIRAMEADVIATLRRAWEDDPPELSMDESPAAALKGAIRALVRRWETRFAAFANRIGRKFTVGATANADRGMMSALRDAGFTVQFKMTDAAQTAFTSVLNEQVNLIKSIPQRALTQVETIVNQSVQVGRDVGGLAKALEQQFGVERRRARLIARDQNNKATAVINLVRQRELGITKARWLHSAGGKVPRPTHVKAGQDRTLYDVDKGWFDPHEKKFIYPGELINCRCVAISVIPGLED